MHSLLAKEIVKTIKQREKEGDHIITSAVKDESMENCILELARQLDKSKKAISFYDSVSCLLAEGVEFMSKSEIFDAIKKEYNSNK